MYALGGELFLQFWIQDHRLLHYSFQLADELGISARRHSLMLREAANGLSDVDHLLLRARLRLLLLAILIGQILPL